MTGASLGVRSSSYASLLQQPRKAAILPTEWTQGSFRKTSRPFPGSREKERISTKICKFVGRSKVGMLLLLVVSTAVFSFIQVVSQDEDALAGLNTQISSTDVNWYFLNHRSPSRYSLSSPLILAKQSKIDTPLGSDLESSWEYNITNNSTPILHSTPHPCKNFVIPPSPADVRHTGPHSCPVCYIPVEQALLFGPPSTPVSRILQNLSYFSVDNLIAIESNGGSYFGGHPSLLQINESFKIKQSMTVHCGFMIRTKSGQGTGFDIDSNVLLEMEECHDVVVASAIFGNYDVMQPPKNISEYAKKMHAFTCSLMNKLRLT